MTFRVGALCAGYGGIELGLTMAGIDHQPVWYSELEESASAPLLNHHTGAPNLGDLTQITEPPEADIITAGFPCQPFSTAGLRKGTEDERWLIDDVCRVARVAGAAWLVLENVPGLLTANNGNAMARVCAAMARNGYRRWEWGTLRASDVGACHIRKRWFCIGRNPDIDTDRLLPAPAEKKRQANAHSTADCYLPTPAAWDGARGPDLARANRPESGGHDLVTVIERYLPTPTTTSNPNEGEDQTKFDERQLARIAAGSRPSPRPLGMVVQNTDWVEYVPAIERHERMIGRPAPTPTNDNKLSPLFVEWMMGLPEGHVTNHITHRGKALHTLGNGVVPQQAAHQITTLAHRITDQ